ncbi:hypothetical protein Q667_18255 [Marinobacter sp. C1S70]|uniref:hypothetical protein n=1 Tax=Marinobacter sp. C1S70 TaxID=1396859 RepID=UPI0003B84CCA|nr:hypothetical protein [Marinobacter sp. C1S70]ERS84169.1 hypothetical protein Q667_18255 [Marinobacter sp. C1S70]
MIYEYALEPAVLTSWASNNRDYAEFLREYGLGTARIVSSFPKKKASKLRSYLLQHCPQDAQSLTGQRYTEMVLKVVESIVVRDVQVHNTAEWAEAAVIENRRAPFDVILSSTGIQEGNNVTPASMYSQGSIWNHSGQVNISRTNEGLLGAVLNLIRLADARIVIVDPFGWTVEAISFIQFMLQSITNNRVSERLPAIMLFYKEKRGSGNSGNGSPSADHVRQQIFQALTFDVSDLQLEVFELRETENNDVFHNRCILTEHGGVITGHGISVSGDDSHTDEAILMKPEIYQKKWRQFIEQICFQIVSEARV